MRYTVTWKPLAEQTLATIWVDASDRAAVSAAANTLAVYFDVLENDRMVQVLTVRYLPGSRA